MDSCKASNIELINKKFGSNIDRHMKKHSRQKMKLVASSNEIKIKYLKTSVKGHKRPYFSDKRVYSF